MKTLRCYSPAQACPLDDIISPTRWESWITQNRKVKKKCGEKKKWPFFRLNQFYEESKKSYKKCDTNSPGSVTVHLSSFSAELAPKCDSRHMEAGRRVVKSVKLFTLKENKVLVKQKALEKVKESCLSALSCSSKPAFLECMRVWGGPESVCPAVTWLQSLPWGQPSSQQQLPPHVSWYCRSEWLQNRQTAFLKSNRLRCFPLLFAEDWAVTCGSGSDPLH